MTFVNFVPMYRNGVLKTLVQTSLRSSDKETLPYLAASPCSFLEQWCSLLNNLFLVCSFMNFNTCIDLCNHHCNQGTEHSIYPQNSLMLSHCSQFLFLILKSWQQFSIAIILPFLECHQWNLRVCSPLRCFFHLALCLWDSSMLCVSIVYSLFYFELLV